MTAVVREAVLAKYFARSWWLRSRRSALEDRKTFPPARRERRAGEMSEPEREIMKTIDAFRNSGNRSSRRRGSLLIPLGLAALLTILTKVHAISPAPDGGYFNGNTAEGENALFNLDVSSSHFDTAVGFHALFNDTGGLNTAIGAGALESNTSGIGNVAVGGSALTNNLSANSNTAVGFFAMLSNTTGSDNTACGESALQSNTTGGHNTAVGRIALVLNNTGANNTATGD